jgi:copper chaperone CopZ
MTSIRSMALVLALSGAGIVMLPTLAHAKTVTDGWYVEGMHGSADVRHVRDAVKRLPSVTYVKVSQATVDVSFDDRALSRADIAAAIAHAGSYRLMQRYE